MVHIMESKLYKHQHALSNQFNDEAIRALSPSIFDVFRRPKKIKPDKLCDACSALAFQDIFAPADGTRAYNLNTLLHVDKIQGNFRCPFCRLVLQTLAVADADENLWLNAADYDGKIGKTLIVTSEYFGSFLKEKSVDRRLQYPHLLLECQVGIQAMAGSLPSSPTNEGDSLLRGRRVGQYVDMHLLKHWIATCDSHHSSLCGSLSTKTSVEWQDIGLRMIDVVKRCVVTKFVNDKYAALSYVWGDLAVPQLTLQRNTHRRLFTENGLADYREDIPHTIKDAMNLCQSMEVRYLWVDALCIDQEDLDDQIHQIEHMHVVYQMANFTIVAADGLDSWAGLSGMSPREMTQHVETVGDFHLANVLPPYIHAIRQSVWSRRAWTLQEMYFSRRMIYFTKRQAFFQCDNALWREDIIMEAPVEFDVKCIDSRRGHSHGLDVAFYKKPVKHWKDGPWRTYCGMVHDYTNRSLTDPYDVLNAFGGIIAKLSAEMDCHFFWGLPTAKFDEALLFHHGGAPQPTQRPGFPSWSWTGWQEDEEQPLIGSVHCQYQEEGEKLNGILDWYHTQQGAYQRINNGPIRVTPAFLRPEIVLELEPPPSGLGTDELNQLLIVQTSSCFVKIKPGSTIASVISGDVSTRNIDRLSGEVDKARKIELMVVMSCFSKLFNSSEGLKVMAIKTDERGVSRRVGLLWAAIDVNEWITYQPTWRTVFLM